MARAKRYRVAIGFNVVTDPENDPVGIRFEPSDETYTLSQFPDGIDVGGLIRAGALVTVGGGAYVGEAEADEGDDDDG